MRTKGPPPAGADAAARASIETWRLYVGAIPGALFEERDGAALVVTGIPSSGFNGVWVERRDAPVAIVERMLDRAASSGVPHCLQLRAGTDPALNELPRRRGMVLDDEEPTMVLDDRSRLAAALDAPGLTIRRLTPHEGTLHARVAAIGFDTVLEAFAPAATEQVLSVPGVRSYVGLADGEPVSTAVGVTCGGATAILAVATLPRYRRRGFAAAVTARAVSDGFAAGARWAWLQAAPAATGMYERLGFRPVDVTAIWVRE
ncbi:MAG TPA: GNAT family N-acetyltransferase [Actinomycetota bacterium]|nr:GNAT family N-acetyltransferase [Actinomycetota bacterium]